MKKIIPALLLAGSIIISGCGDSNDFNEVSGQQGNPVPFTPSAPIAVDDVYSTDEDDAITLTAAQGVLVNDQANDQTQFVTVEFPATTAQGGTITGTAASGAFTYTPALGFTGTDSFSYTLENSVGEDTATVTIEVDAAVVAQGYFVDSANGNDATADFDTGAPYATIQAAVLAAPANSDIVVRPGNYAGAVTLKNGQRLRGANGGNRPVLSGNIILGDGNTVDFLRIQDSADDAINGDDRNGGTVTNCEIVNSGGEGVQARPGAGTWVVSDNTITDCFGIGVRLGTEGTGQMRAQVNDNTITGSGFGAIGFVAENDSELVAQVHGNTMTGNQDFATFEAIVGDTAIMSLDIEDNTNDDVYMLSNENTGSVLNVEELVVGPPASIPSNTGTVTIDTGTGTSPPTSVADGFCGF